MASVSYGLNRGALPSYPEDINVGTLAVTSNDIELRWDNTKSLTRFDIIRAINAFERRLLDGDYNDPLNI